MLVSQGFLEDFVFWGISEWFGGGGGKEELLCEPRNQFFLGGGGQFYVRRPSPLKGLQRNLAFCFQAAQTIKPTLVQRGLVNRVHVREPLTLREFTSHDCLSFFI